MPSYEYNQQPLDSNGSFTNHTSSFIIVLGFDADQVAVNGAQPQVQDPKGNVMWRAVVNRSASTFTGGGQPTAIDMTGNTVDSLPVFILPVNMLVPPQCKWTDAGTGSGRFVMTVICDSLESALAIL